MLQYQSFLYVLEIIQIELISKLYNNPLIGYFKIKKIRELIVQKSYCRTLRYDIETYVKKYNICLTSKIVK